MWRGSIKSLPQTPLYSVALTRRSLRGKQKLGFSTESLDSILWSANWTRIWDPLQQTISGGNLSHFLPQDESALKLDTMNYAYDARLVCVGEVVGV